VYLNASEPCALSLVAPLAGSIEAAAVGMVTTVPAATFCKTVPERVS
jgi:hypothetical protein